MIVAYTDSACVSVISTYVSEEESPEFIAIAAPPPIASVAARIPAVILAPREAKTAEDVAAATVVAVAAPVAAVAAAAVEEATDVVAAVAAAVEEATDVVVAAAVVAEAAEVVAVVAASVVPAAEDTASPISAAFAADTVAGSPRNIVIRGSKEMP